MNAHWNVDIKFLQFCCSVLEIKHNGLIEAHSETLLPHRVTKDSTLLITEFSVFPNSGEQDRK